MAPRSSRFHWIQLSVLFFFFVLLARLVYVQGFLKSDLRFRANLQAEAGQPSERMRRRILDRNGVVLAETVDVTSCFVDPSLIKNPAVLAKKLSAKLGIGENVLAQKIKKTKGSFLWIKRDVSPTAVAAIKELKLAGVGFKSEFRRSYPLGPLSSHLMGLLGLDGHGLSGIEQIFEKSLDTKIPIGKITKDGIPAGPVQLSLDAAIQRIAERELDWGARKISAKKGMVLVQEPKSGEVLAVATWPPVSLDPDHPPHPNELRQPALVDVFEPGSTFKIIVGAAALEEQIVRKGEIFSGENGSWDVMGITLHDHEPHNKMTFEDIITYSSNIGTAKLAERLGSERLYQYARLFGFGVYPGSGVSGEAKGVLRPPSEWSGISKFSISFGQEVGVTAVQLMGAFSAIANGGILMEPHFVKGVQSVQGDLAWRVSPVRVRRVVSQETATELNRILTKAVERGTGVNAQIQWDPKMKVAGKTGTAQKYDNKHRRYHESLTLVSFCGFFPAENPLYTIVVLLDEPEGRRWGGLDAAPIFRRIAEQISPRGNSI